MTVSFVFLWGKGWIFVLLRVSVRNFEVSPGSETNSSIEEDGMYAVLIGTLNCL